MSPDRYQHTTNVYLDHQLLTNLLSIYEVALFLSSRNGQPISGPDLASVLGIKPSALHARIGRLRHLLQTRGVTDNLKTKDFHIGLGYQFNEKTLRLISFDCDY